MARSKKFLRKQRTTATAGSKMQDQDAFNQRKVFVNVVSLELADGSVKVVPVGFYEDRATADENRDKRGQMISQILGTSKEANAVIGALGIGSVKVMTGELPVHGRIQVPKLLI